MNHEESKLQQQCVAWFRAQYPHYAMLLVHPINEGSGHTQMDRRRQGIHKAEGAVAGVPDLFLFLPAVFIEDKSVVGSSVILGIELKTSKGKQSQEQKDFERVFTAAGSYYYIVRSLDEFIEIINEYMKGVPISLLRNIEKAHSEIVKAAEAKEREHFYKVIGKK